MMTNNHPSKPADFSRRSVKIKCVVCEKDIPDKECVEFRPYDSKVLVMRKSKRTIEFLESGSGVESPYMDVCEQCFRKVLRKMRILRYFKNIISEDRKLSGLVTGSGR